MNKVNLNEIKSLLLKMGYSVKSLTSKELIVYLNEVNYYISIEDCTVVVTSNKFNYYYFFNDCNCKFNLCNYFLDEKLSILSNK